MKPQDFNHFGHEHLLIPLVLDEDDELYCKACDHLIVQPFHGCLSCNYYLHDECLNIPRSILHPSHPNHPLTLLPIPTYPTSSFTCNACQSQGLGFSYSCAHCEFDVHIRCASLPTKLKVGEQHPHELKLVFESLTGQDCRKYYCSLFKCEVCGVGLESDCWRYYCDDCDFGMHLGCVKIDNQDVGLMSHSAVVEAIKSGGLEGKSGTAQAVLLAEDKTVDDDVEKMKLSASVTKIAKYL
ncbi:OLC1v1001673C1 [Oldenlandia corymbosa var. corymbosa]|uniref:OLC1v1001673C1 n=1 Tax=Oldenlandia corymbosa var. corymbosa TaxID=529605 RepID=A0AAV1D5U9_OLDCO|nr:OLC1v1001673C1 [Oldenlandia corymbosa var. corymbosa]